MDEIRHLIKEWETLRQENDSSINNRIQIISFGLATIGIITAGILSSNLIKGYSKLFLLAFNFGIPAISVRHLETPKTYLSNCYRFARP